MPMLGSLRRQGVLAPSRRPSRAGADSGVLRLEDVDALRRLAVPRAAAPELRRLEVELDLWEAPSPRWRGRIGQLRSLTGFTARFDPDARTAGAQVTLADPTPLHEIANALIPLFCPDARLAGAGFPLIAVDPSAGEAVLPLLAGRRVPPVEPMIDALQGVGLRRADVLLAADGSVDLGDESATHEIGVNEALHGRPRTELPVIDLNVHNPIGRLVGFAPSPAPRTLEIDGSSARVEDVTGGGAAPIAFDLRAPLTAAHVRALREIESIDLSRVAQAPAGLAARLAELAATGVVLHGLREAVRFTPDELSPRIAEAIRRPYRPSIGLERERRSVALRRAAMHDHGGFFRLAGAVEHRTGQRILPRVSVVLSTMRPELVAGVLEMMAKQTYPHMEVVVVLHGVPEPDLAGVDLTGLDYTLVQVPGTVLFGAALAEGVRRSSGDLITKLDDDDWYSEHHVFDLVLASLYSRADIVGKTTEYLYFEEVRQSVHRTFATERYHDQVAGGAMMLSRSTFDELGGWRPTPNSTDRSVLIRVETQGGIGYRTHGLGYVYIRHTSKHTWERTGSQLLRGSFEQWRGWRTPEV